MFCSEIIFFLYFSPLDWPGVSALSIPLPIMDWFTYGVDFAVWPLLTDIRVPFNVYTAA